MEAIINLAIPVLFVLALVVERLFPARELPRVRGWLLKGTIFFLLTGVVNAILPLVLATVIGPHIPWSIASLGIVGGALVGLVVGDFVAYWVHRGLHRNNTVWRWTHQMHHSAERMDIAGFAYFHPFDMFIQVGGAALAAILVGASAEAAMIAGFASFLMAVVQHLNVKTPVWLGYVIQRPESHSVHHGRGIHAYNYGNLALWDLVFGTFRNPREFNAETGFWQGASSKIGAMLVGRDVGAPGTR
ncbi:MAG TPA: sterol desaturase family protein [Kofleriaceae bacterium]|nr:sterol desaturase family protein [Kofleriaceae bacterium]